jgi:hypothetical protein
MAMQHSHQSPIAAKAALGILFVFSAMSSCIGHELEVDRLTIVMRNQSHLSLIFRVDEISLLGRILAPDASTLEFAVSMAAIEDQKFDNLIDHARKKLSSEIILVGQNSKKIALQNWRWDSKDQLRVEMRKIAMAAIVGGEGHSHPRISEVYADAIADTPISSVMVSLPAEAEKILVVSYKTTEKYFDASLGSSLKVEF